MARATARRSHRFGPGIRPGRDKPYRTRASLSASSSRKQRIDPEATRLLLSMDYGTKTLSIAYRIAKADNALELNDIVDLYFPQPDTPDFAPQKAAWASDGTFYWGYVYLIVHPTASQITNVSRAFKKRSTGNSSHKTMSSICGSCCSTRTISHPVLRSK